MFGMGPPGLDRSQQRREDGPDRRREANEEGPAGKGCADHDPAAGKRERTLSLQYGGSPTHLRLLGASRAFARYVSDYTFTSLSDHSAEYVAFYSNCADSAPMA